MSHGGKAVLPILVGDATVILSQSIKSKTDSSTPYDTIVTRHVSLEEYSKATGSDAYKEAASETQQGEENGILTYGFENSTLYVEWLFPIFQKVYVMLNWKVDCDTPVPQELKTTDMYDLTQPNGDSGYENYKRLAKAFPDQKHVYVLEFITKHSDTAGSQQAEFDYNKAWLEAAYSYDVKRSFGGTFLSLDDGPKTFSEVAIMKFPSREIYMKWLESSYFHKLQGNRQAFILDSHIQISLPMY